MNILFVFIQLFSLTQAKIEFEIIFRNLFAFVEVLSHPHYFEVYPVGIPTEALFGQQYFVEGEVSLT